MLANAWATGRGTYKPEEYEEDAEAVEVYYRNEGYITARVGQPELDYLDAPEDAEKRGLMDALASSGIEARIEDRADSLLLFPQNGALSVEGIDLNEFQVTRRPGNLEDAFLRLTGRGLRENL